MLPSSGGPARASPTQTPEFCKEGGALPGSHPHSGQQGEPHPSSGQGGACPHLVCCSAGGPRKELRPLNPRGGQHLGGYPGLGSSDGGRNWPLTALTSASTLWPREVDRLLVGAPVLTSGPCPLTLRLAPGTSQL